MTNTDITRITFEDMARLTSDPAVYVMAILHLGFAPSIYSKLANECWNRVHPDRKLPVPKRGKKERCNKEQ